MPLLTTTRQYADGEVYTKAAVDAPLDDIEIFFNNIKINDDNLQNNGITAAIKFVNGSITEQKISSAAVSTMKIQNNAVTTPKILDQAVSESKFAEESITTDKLDIRAVDTIQLENQAVDTDLFENNAVTSNKISSNPDDEMDDLRAVTTDHIKNGSITTKKIQDNSVSPVKQSVYYLSHRFNFIDSSTTDAAIITVSGSRPVKLTVYTGMLAISNSASRAEFYIEYSANGSDWVVIYQTNIPAFNNFYIGSSGIPALNPALYTGTGPIVTVHEDPLPGEAFYRLRSNNSTLMAKDVRVPFNILVKEL